MNTENKPDSKIFYKTILWILIIYLLFKWVVPVVSKLITGHEHPLPIPGALMAIYMALVFIGAGVYISSSEERFRGFLHPIIQLLRGKAPRALGLAVFILFPLLVGFIVWKQSTSSMKSPTLIRIQHPTIPQKFERLENPYRHPMKYQNDPQWDSIYKAYLSFASEKNMRPEAAATREAFLEETIKEGRDLYQMNCRPCHGTKAGGPKADDLGPLARGLRLKPANFQDAGTIATVVESYVFWRVTEGGIGLPPEASPWDSAMPRWKEDLTAEQIWKIILAEYETAGVEPRTPEKLAE